MGIEFNSDINTKFQKTVVSDKETNGSVSVSDSYGLQSDNSNNLYPTSSNSQALMGKNFRIVNKVNKDFLKKEISTLLDSQNEKIFSLQDAEQIIEERNELEELSEILNLFKTNNIKMSAYDFKELLSDERLMSENISKRIVLFNELKNNPIFTDILEQYGEQKLADATISSRDEISVNQLVKNAQSLNYIKTLRPELYKNLTEDSSYFNLRCILDGKIEPEALKSILDSELLDDNFYKDAFLSILNKDATKSTVQKNIEILEYLKNNPKSAFLFDVPNHEISFALAYKLTKETPPDFDIAKKQGVIDLFLEMNNNPSTKKRLSLRCMFNILFSERNDLYEDGKKLLDLIQREQIPLGMTEGIFNFASFKDTLEFLNLMENPKEFVNNFPGIFYDAKDKDMNKFKNLIKILNYAEKKDYAKENLFGIYHLFSTQVENQDSKSPLNNLDKAKAVIDKFDSILSLLPENIQASVFNSTLETLLNDKNVEIKKDNIEVFNNLLKNEKFALLLSYMPDQDIFEFLTTDCNVDKLKENQKFLADLLESEDIQSEHFAGKLVFFDGNVEKLCEKYKELSSQHINLFVEINKDNKNVSLNCYDSGASKTYIFDKNMELLSEQNHKYLDEKNLECVISDKKTNSKHKMILPLTMAKDELSCAKKVISKYFDAKGNVIKTKCYNQSLLDGSVNIKEQVPGENLKVLSDVRETALGTFVEKELTSCDGTKSFIKSFIDLDGNENYTYKITDENGEVLLEHKRTSKKIDDNTTITSINNKEYKVITGKDCIEVIDCTNNEKTVIDLNKLCKDGRRLNVDKMLKSMPGDELIKLDKNVTAIGCENSLESYFNNLTGEIATGGNKFIFEHELGHAKDITHHSIKKIGNISSDKKLQAIYKNELDNMNKNLPACIKEIVNYFTAGSKEHYAGEFGGLVEIVAETNALQSTAQSHPMLQMRTQILQEYFPRTIAYLIKNHLAC